MHSTDCIEKLKAYWHNSSMVCKKVSIDKIETRALDHKNTSYMGAYVRFIDINKKSYFVNKLKELLIETLRNKAAAAQAEVLRVIYYRVKETL